MADKSNNMDPQGLPPDSDLLLAYLKREMSNAEKHELEKRMLADDFLADAAEGLTAVNNPLVIADIKAQINAKVSKPAAKPGVPKRSPLAVVGNTLAIAASISLLVVAAWFISQSVSNKKPVNVADSRATQQNNANAPVTEQLSPATAQTPADSLVANQTPAEQKPNFTKAVRNFRLENVVEVNESDAEDVAPANYNWDYGDAAVAQPATTTLGNTSSPATLNTTPVYGNSTNIYDKYGPASNTNNGGYYKTPILEGAKGKKNTAKSNVAADSISDTWGNRTAIADEESPGEYINGVMIRRENDNFGATEGKSENVANETVPTKSVAKEVVSPSNKALSRGLEKYNRGDYRSAINDLEDALKADPNNYKAQYSLAMAYKNTNKPDNALTRFNKIPASSPYYENAQWEIANIYLNKNDDAKCIEVLKKIVKLNGAYKIRAQKIIDNLEN